MTTGTAGSPRSSGTSAYRQVLTIPGAVRFSVAALVGRLPISMIGLGIVILVSARTGSYAQAGALSATYVLLASVAAVPLARLVDRLGQGRVLGVAVTVSVAGLALVTVAVEHDWRAPWPHVFAGLAGAAMPNIGAAVRARWSHVVHDRALLDTAFAVEAVNDELVFMLGPTITTALATALHPAAGLVAAGTAALVGTWWLVSQHSTEPPRRSAEEVSAEHATSMPWARLAPLVAGAMMLGVLFGGTEVATVAFADEAGHPAAAGLLLAAWALGSLISGAVSGTIVMRRSAAARYRLGILALAVLMCPVPFVGGLWLLGGFLFLAGFAISPTLIASVSWVETLVPADRLNEGMTVLTTGLTVGVAPGAAAVGAVVDGAGASTAYLIPAGAGVVGAVVAFLTSDRLK